jgi:mRNA interferase MazF
MTTYDCGDIVLVPFPFSDDPSTAKRRPAVVLSTDEYNLAGEDYILAQITSRIATPRRPGDHLVVAWREAGLLAPSLVRAKLMTLHRDLIDRKFGEMSAVDLVAVRSALAPVLGLTLTD